MAKPGVLGICLMALSAWIASSANTKTAEARSSLVPALATSTPAQPARVTTSIATVAAPLAPVVAPLSPIAIELEIITPPPADLRLENPKLRRMQKEEISPAMLALAAKLVREHYAKPVGTQVEVDVEGKHVTARLERHFHPEGGPVKPWGFHPGVSLFVNR